MAHGRIAALGFRAHTGWAVAVAVTPDWQVIARHRIAYEPAPTRFVYHRAAEMAAKEAEALIRAARAQCAQKARQEIETLVSALGEKTVAGAGVPGGNVTLPASLADILAAHSRIHAAEGAFYRDVLQEACERIGLAVRRTPERDLWAVAGKAAGCSEDELRDRLIAMGRQLGPPWGED